MYEIPSLMAFLSTLFVERYFVGMLDAPVMARYFCSNFRAIRVKSESDSTFSFLHSVHIASQKLLPFLHVAPGERSSVSASSAFMFISNLYQMTNHVSENRWRGAHIPSINELLPYPKVSSIHRNRLDAIQSNLFPTSSRLFPDNFTMRIQISDTWRARVFGARQPSLAATV